MGSIIKMAFRNIFRFKRRTLITFTAVSLGLALLIISISLLDGIDKQSIGNIVNSQTGFLTVFLDGYFEKKDDLPVGITIGNPHPVLTELAGDKRVKAVEGRVLFPATLIKGSDELPCRGVGVDPSHDPGLFNIMQSLVKGTWLNSGESRVLIGSDLARDLSLAVGDRVALRLITSDREEELSWNALDVEIGGIVDTGNPAVDGQSVIMPLKLAQEGLGLKEGVTEIAIRLNIDPADLGRLESLKRELHTLIQRNHPDLRIYTWEELAGIFKAISNAKKERTNMIIFIMVFVAAMGIINTMLMAVFERTREIGMLSALGMSRREILTLILLEGTFIGVLGSLLGCVLGGAVGWLLETKGLSLTALAGETMSKLTQAIYPVKNVFYADVSWGVILQTFILGTAIAAVSSLYPSWKATRLSPVEALRHI